MATRGRSRVSGDKDMVVGTEPVTERGRDTKQRILQSAEQVFGEMGFYEASITRIVQMAGIAQGTFYLYFSSKKDAFVAVVDYLATELRQEIHQATRDVASREAVEREGFRAFWQFVAKHPLSYRIVRQAEFVDPVAFRRYYQNLAKGYRRGLEAAMQAGEFISSNTEALSYALMGVGDFIGMRYVLFSEGGEVSEDVFRDVMRFVFFGLKGPNGGADGN